MLSKVPPLLHSSVDLNCRGSTQPSCFAAKVTGVKTGAHTWSAPLVATWHSVARLPDNKDPLEVSESYAALIYADWVWHGSDTSPDLVEVVE